MGRKRVELFAEITSIRNGWLSVGADMPDNNFDINEYQEWFLGNGVYPDLQDYKGGRYLGTTPEVENLRPKSPNRNANNVSTIGSIEDFPMGRSNSGRGNNNNMFLDEN